MPGDQIDVAPLESDDLALTQTGFGAQEHERPTFRIGLQRFGEPRQLLESQKVEFLRWDFDRRLRSQPGPPRSVSSSELLKRLTAKLKGSISYIEADQLDGGVRALSVDGSQYTEAAYALR